MARKRIKKNKYKHFVPGAIATSVGIPWQSIISKTINNIQIRVWARDWDLCVKGVWNPTEDILGISVFLVLGFLRRRDVFELVKNQISEDIGNER